MSGQSNGRHRRVVTGVDETDQSMLVSDGVPPLRAHRPTGLEITEVWRTNEATHPRRATTGILGGDY